MYVCASVCNVSPLIVQQEPAEPQNKMVSQIALIETFVAKFISKYDIIARC